MAEDAGLPRPDGQDLTDDTSRDISLEDLPLADGGEVFHAAQGGDTSELTSLPLRPSLTAVLTGNTVQVDDDAFFLNIGPAAAHCVSDQLTETLTA